MIAHLWHRLTAPFRPKPDPFVIQMETAADRMRDRRLQTVAKTLESREAQRRDRARRAALGRDPFSAAFFPDRPDDERGRE